MQYKAIPVSSDLCVVALEQCIHMGLPPSWEFNLHISPNLCTSARGVVRFLLAQQGDNPFLPHFNLVIEKSFGPYEWCIEAGGVAIGSTGT